VLLYHMTLVCTLFQFTSSVCRSFQIFSHRVIQTGVIYSQASRTLYGRTFFNTSTNSLISSSVL
jgi:hypothetical protein